jgi:hypothetical protein
MPFGGVGIVFGIVGSVMVVYGGFQRRRGIAEEQTTSPDKKSEVWSAALLVIILLIISVVLGQVDLTGPGWSIVIYGAQSLYLNTLGFGMLLFAGFGLATRNKLGAFLLAMGVLFCGISLLVSYTLSSDFSLRCSPDVGCSPVLANSTVSEMINLGYLLAVGAFLLALGLSITLNNRTKVGS